MPCQKISTKNVTVILCYNNAYNYKGFMFEHHNYLGPTPLKKNGEIRRNTPKGFWGAYEEWGSLPEKEKKKYLISPTGGVENDTSTQN